jgi:hypothetical protein
MILLALIAALSVAAVAGSLVVVARDGYRAAPTRADRIPDRPTATTAAATTAAAATATARTTNADRTQENRRNTPAPRLRARRVS